MPGAGWTAVGAPRRGVDGSERSPSRSVRAARRAALDCIRRRRLVLADLAGARPGLAVRQADVVGEDILVVDDPVGRRVRIDVPGVGPDGMCVDALVDGQAAVVTVEPALDPIRWREDR